MARKVIDEPSEDVVEIARREKASHPNPISRIVLFVKQVFGELRKVVTPTRKELINYTLVVLAFVVVMMALVSGLDYLFGWAAVFVFGNPGSTPL